MGHTRGSPFATVRGMVQRLRERVRVRPPRPRRLIPLLWGTTNFADCWAALWYIARPWHLVRGPAIAEYENAFAQSAGVRFGVSFASGRVGLYGILRSLGIGPGDEVLLQVPTHVVVADAVRYTGARPVFVDCQRETFNMDLSRAEQAAGPHTRAIVLQHTFGVPADIDGAQSLARRRNLFLIEDCVHALGARYRGRPAGSFGIAAFYSTEETKVISSMMGGMAVTNDGELARKLRVFQEGCAWPSATISARYIAKIVLYHFAGSPWLHPYTFPIYTRLRRAGRISLSPSPTSGEEQLGLKPRNYERRLSNAQAAIALRQLRRLDANVTHRRAIAALYERRLAQAGMPVIQNGPNVEPSYLRYPVWVEDPDAAQRRWRHGRSWASGSGRSSRKRPPRLRWGTRKGRALWRRRS